MQRPLKTRDIGQVSEVPARLEFSEELSEGASVFEEAGATWWMALDVLAGSVSKEPFVDQPADDWIGRPEPCRQRGEDVVTVDLQPSARRQAITEHLG